MVCSHVNATCLLIAHGFHAIHKAMYIETVPNRGSPPAILLRESYRDGKTVRKRTLLNLSH